MTTTIDALGNVFATPRDIDGNIIKEIHPETYDPVTKDGEGIAYEYDLFHHRTKIRYPDGGVERIKYDATGNIVKKIMPLQYHAETDDGEGWSYVYDEVNRLVEITNPEGTIQKRYVYDLHGNIVKRMDAAGFLSGNTDGVCIGELFTYNCMGWLTESRKPVKQEDGAVWYALTQYGYDAVGNMVKEIRYRDFQTIDSERGAIHTINYTYDEENRLICVSDCTGAVVKYAYNSIGQRISEHRKINDDTERVFIYHYDTAGRLAELKQSADEKGCGHKTSSIRYEYDHNGNLTRIRLPYGAEIRREYDAKDRLTAKTHSEKSSNIQNTIRFCYDKADNLTRITDNLGRETEFSYDLMNQEIKRRERDGGITRTVYDHNGNPVKIIRPNQYAQYGEKGSGIQYIYDSLDQITTVINADGRIQETYAYDKSGNLREKLDGNGNRVYYTYDLDSWLLK